MYLIQFFGTLVSILAIAVLGFLTLVKPEVPWKHIVLAAVGSIWVELIFIRFAIRYRSTR